jgi:hypothetical protein
LKIEQCSAIIPTCETTCMAASFQQEGKLGPIKSSLALSFVIEYPVLIQQNEQSYILCVRDIDFAFSYDLDMVRHDIHYVTTLRLCQHNV